MIVIVALVAFGVGGFAVALWILASGLRQVRREMRDEEDERE